MLLKFDIKKRIDRKIEFESEISYDRILNNVGDDLSVVPIRETQLTGLEPVYSMQEYEKGYDETVRQNVAVFESNEIMENALREADNGNYDRAREQILTGKSYMNEQMQNIQPSPEMNRQLDVMEKYNEDLNSAETKSEEEKKEMQKSGKFDNYKSRKGDK